MYLIKSSTGITVPVFAHDVNGDAVTGLVNAGFTKRISKNGGAFAAMTVTITEMENGWYSVPISTSHSDTVGIASITLTHASCKQINIQLRVSARLVDDVMPTYTQPTGFLAATFPTGTVANTTNMDKTGYSLSTAGILAIWHQLTSAIVTASTIGKLIVDNLNATISSRSTYAGGDTSGTTTILSRIIGTLAAGTHTAQTGDSFPLANGANGFVALKADTAATNTTLDEIMDDGTAVYDRTTDSLQAIKDAVVVSATLIDNFCDEPLSGHLTAGTVGKALADIGTPAGASVSADIAAVKADTAATKTKSDSLIFTKANELDVNIQSVNGITVTGDGSPGTEWGA